VERYGHVGEKVPHVVCLQILMSNISDIFCFSAMTGIEWFDVKFQWLVSKKYLIACITACYWLQLSGSSTICPITEAGWTASRRLVSLGDWYSVVMAAIHFYFILLFCIESVLVDFYIEAFYWLLFLRKLFIYSFCLSLVIQARIISLKIDITPTPWSIKNVPLLFFR